MKSSSLLLMLGVAFSLGQTSRLGYEFLYSFNYIDFIIASVRLIPFIFVVFIIMIAVNWIVLNPILKLYNIRGSIKNSDHSIRHKLSHIVNGLSYFAIIFLSAVILYLLIKFTLSLQDFFLLFFGILFCAVILNRTNKTFPTSIPLFINETMSWFWGSIDKILANYVIGLVSVSIIALFCGIWSIDFQKKGGTDAFLSIVNEKVEKEVNIVASNSNVIMVIFEDKVELVPRTQITKIRYIGLDN